MTMKRTSSVEPEQHRALPSGSDSVSRFTKMSPHADPHSKGGACFPKQIRLRPSPFTPARNTRYTYRILQVMAVMLFGALCVCTSVYRSCDRRRLPDKRHSHGDGKCTPEFKDLVLAYNKLRTMDNEENLPTEDDLETVRANDAYAAIFNRQSYVCKQLIEKLELDLLYFIRRDTHGYVALNEQDRRDQLFISKQRFCQLVSKLISYEKNSRTRLTTDAKAQNVIKLLTEYIAKLKTYNLKDKELESTTRLAKQKHERSWGKYLNSPLTIQAENDYSAYATIMEKCGDSTTPESQEKANVAYSKYISSVDKMRPLKTVAETEYAAYEKASEVYYAHDTVPVENACAQLNAAVDAL